MIIPIINGIANSGLDNDAEEFVRVAKITDQTQIRAINDLCKDLKREGFWDTMYRAFPFVWNGTTASMLVDLKNRIIATYSATPNGITFSSTGVKFQDGIFQLSSECWSPFFYSNTTPGHISMYARDALSQYQVQFHGYIDIFSNTGAAIGIQGNSDFYGTLWSTSGYGAFTFSGSSTGLFLYSNVDNEGGMPASVTDPYIFYASKNGQILGTHSATTCFTYIGVTPTLGGYVQGGSPQLQSTQEICWWSFGMGDTEVLEPGATINGPGYFGRQIDMDKQHIFYEIIQKFQTKLGRQV